MITIRIRLGALLPILILFALCCCVFSASSIEVSVQQGRLAGASFVSRNGTEYYGFLGIPFAKPPLGELRFEVSNFFFFGLECKLDNMRKFNWNSWIFSLPNRWSLGKVLKMWLNIRPCAFKLICTYRMRIKVLKIACTWMCSLRRWVIWCFFRVFSAHTVCLQVYASYSQ